MKRRAYLALTGGALVAGCLSGGSSDDDGGGDGSGSDGSDGEGAAATPSPTASPTPSPEPASFSIVSVDAPTEVEIEQEFTFSLTVENTGGTDGTFETDLYVRTPDSSDERVGTIEIDVPAGEQATWESGPSSYPYLTKLIFTLDPPGQSFELQLLTRVLPFDETYRSPAGIIASVDRIELQSRYSYEGYSGGTEYEEAASGMQWAFVYVTAENDSGSSEWVPLVSDIALRAENQQFDSEFILKEQDAYDGGEVGPGVVRSGWIAYEIPEEFAVGDLTVEWFETTFEGDYGVRWRRGG